MEKLFKDTEKLAGWDGLNQAAELLQQGELVAVPTETVYGLAADARQPEAVAKIFHAKGRPADHPLIVHIADVAELSEWTTTVPAYAHTLAAAFWPGPLTFILPKAPHVSDIVTGGHPSVGVRCPSHPLMLALLKQLGTGLAAPSANPYKKISPTTAEQVLYGLNGKISAVLDGGACEVGLESTIVDLTTDTPRILRAGPITRQQLEAVLGCTVEQPKQHSEAVSGNVKAHYQPNTPLLVLPQAELLAKLHTANEKTAVMYYSEQVALQVQGQTLLTLKLAADKARYAQSLYYALHQLDQSEANEIWLEQPPSDDAWSDVQDRLARAAYR
ncbi:L-threonylcarbamoyladenylate synthase [Pseudoalteromonas fenneropenaei]|uniref:Threonylcarbamoyl-AMP synthase n=1 Tax=Pseudoalteromonas fenneropenaei TaxID=1737459 RepID=A0ABV7CG40_9GAMM